MKDNIDNITSKVKSFMDSELVEVQDALIMEDHRSLGKGLKAMEDIVNNNEKLLAEVLQIFECLKHRDPRETDYDTLIPPYVNKAPVIMKIYILNNIENFKFLKEKFPEDFI